jgi:hypothetical protein
MPRKYEQRIKATTQVDLELEKRGRDGVRLPPFTIPLFTDTVRKDREL